MNKYFWWLPFGNVSEIDATVLSKKLQENSHLYLIDVRSPIEWRQSHIPGAINLPLLQLKNRITSLECEKNHLIVTICLSAHRSIPAVRLLKAHHFTNVMQLRGGMLSWWKNHLPTNNQ